jgi:hypothetical protein
MMLIERTKTKLRLRSRSIEIQSKGELRMLNSIKIEEKHMTRRKPIKRYGSQNKRRKVRQMFLYIKPLQMENQNA